MTHADSTAYERYRWRCWPFSSDGLARAATVEEIALMNRADRQKILVEGARKEGKVSWYTTLIVDQVVRPVKEAFEKEYPFIQVEYFRANSERSSRKKSSPRIRPNVMRRRGRRHGVADHGAAGRLAATVLLADVCRVSGGAQGCARFLGRDQSVFLRHRLQYPHGEAERGAEDLRRSAQPALEGADDVVDQPRLGRADVRRHDSQHHGRRRRAKPICKNSKRRTSPRVRRAIGRCWI